MSDDISNNTRTRRGFLMTAGAGTLGLTLAGRSGAHTPKASAVRELLVYVGTYTSGKSEGIYLYRLGLSDGSLEHVGTTAGVVNPSYLTLDRKRRRLYAVNEVEEFEGAPSGGVSAFEIERTSGALRLLNRRRSMGAAPCYITAADSGAFVLVANYLGGNVAVLPVLKDGSLGDAIDLKQDEGSGPNRTRQESAHAHCVLLDHANRFAYSCDLGTDKVMIYRFDRRSGKLTPNTQPSVSLKPGAGPRHLTFHPKARVAYVLNELDSTVTAFAHDPSAGTLRELQTVPTLPSGFDEPNTGADIHVEPGGRFLYCSNRGHDSIASFSIDPGTGRLSVLGHVPSGGKTPRNFVIDPSGTFLLAANQNSDTVVTFRIDPQTGALRPTGHSAEAPSPVCLKLTAPF